MAGLSLETIASVCARAIEETAFLFCERVDDPPAFGPDLLEAEVGFEGEWAASVSMTTSRCTLEAALDNLLDEGVSRESDATVRDTLGEMVNILAGWLAAEAFGTQIPCRLTLPNVRSVTAPPQEAEDRPDLQVVDLVTEDGSRIQVRVRRLGGSGGAHGAQPGDAPT